ncbi:MAG: hypothetical protein WCS77_05495 [Elusimicrobiaceae bacterium]|jgi:hypothetical protein
MFDGSILTQYPYAAATVILLIAAGLLLVSFFAAGRTLRRKRIKRFAAVNGLALTQYDAELEKALADKPLVKNCAKHRVRNIIKGGPLGNACYFDVSCRIHDHHDRVSQSVVKFNTDGRLPVFFLFPKGVETHLPVSAGKVELGDKFSAGYNLFSENTILLREIFKAGAEDFFSHESGWTIEYSKHTALIYRSGNLYSSFELQDFINKSVEVYQTVFAVPPAPPASA